MERMLSPHGIKFEHQHMITRRRCSICERKLDQTAFYLTESNDAPTPQQAWLLCASCNSAVQLSLIQSQLRPAVRTRVAVGLVASARNPEHRAKWWQERYWDELDDRGWNRLIWWFFMAIAFGHIIVFVVLMMYPYLFK